MARFHINKHRALHYAALGTAVACSAALGWLAHGHHEAASADWTEQVNREFELFKEIDRQRVLLGHQNDLLIQAEQREADLPLEEQRLRVLEAIHREEERVARLEQSEAEAEAEASVPVRCECHCPVLPTTADVVRDLSDALGLFTAAVSRVVL